jgi:hypothetical protein
MKLEIFSALGFSMDLATLESLAKAKALSPEKQSDVEEFLKNKGISI